MSFAQARRSDLHRGEYLKLVRKMPWVAALDLDDLKQHALSIQGVCKHRNDQVCMSGRLQVHGCVRPIHTIEPSTPDGLVQCMHDAAIR